MRVSLEEKDGSNIQVTIRRATCTDAPMLAEIGAATFVETFGNLYAAEDLTAFLRESRFPAAYSRILDDPDAAVWLAELTGGPAVGYVTAGSCKLPVPNLEPAAGEVHQLYVRATHQQHRLGSRLLSTALDWLVERQRTPLYVGVWSENLGAQRLYERFGFRRIGEYAFAVGRQLDHEFILKRGADWQARAGRESG